MHDEQCRIHDAPFTMHDMGINNARHIFVSFKVMKIFIFRHEMINRETNMNVESSSRQHKDENYYSRRDMKHAIKNYRCRNNIISRMKKI